MSRKLVTIQKIHSIKPIENADMIVSGGVLGWNVVIKKEEFKDGDLGVFFEIDAFLPANDIRYKFLESKFSNFEGLLGARIKTQKLRGVLSQGLFLPVSLFPEIDNVEDKFIEQTDLSELLSVMKWEPKETSLAANAKGLFPIFLRKSDQERIQNIFEEVKSNYFDEEFEVTMKLDGSSLSAYLNNNEFGLCSRNLELKMETGNHMVDTVIRDDLENAMRCIDRNYMLQCEIVGCGIQGNYEKLTRVEIFVYDVFFIDEQRYATVEERNFIINKIRENNFDIKHVPVIHKALKLSDKFDSLASMLDYADGPGMSLGVLREGYVYKHLTSDFSFKTISNSYLLKSGK